MLFIIPIVLNVIAPTKFLASEYSLKPRNPQKGCTFLELKLLSENNCAVVHGKLLGINLQKLQNLLVLLSTGATRSFQITKKECKAAKTKR